MWMPLTSVMSSPSSWLTKRPQRMASDRWPQGPSTSKLVAFLSLSESECTYLVLLTYLPILQVTQYTCDFNNLAPDGCTQYFFGENSQLVRTYNYQDGAGLHLADQSQNICIRFVLVYASTEYFHPQILI